MSLHIPETVINWFVARAETIVSAWGTIRATAVTCWHTAHAWWDKAFPYLASAWEYAHTCSSYAEWGIAIIAVVAAIYLVRKHGISGLKHKFFKWLERIAHLVHSIHVGSPAGIVLAILIIIGAIFGVPHDHDVPTSPPTNESRQL